MKKVSDPIDRLHGPTSRLNTVLSEKLSPNLNNLSRPNHPCLLPAENRSTWHGRSWEVNLAL